MRFKVGAGLTAILAIASVAQAAPITYLGNLNPGVEVFEVNSQGAGNESNPVGADYWTFYANAGDAVSIDGDRQAGHYDMSLWVLFGTFADTNAFGASFDGGDSSFVLFSDDNTAPNIPGPFGDPLANFVAPSTGFYTVAVTNFLSSAGPPNPYSLTATGVQAVPEPASMMLIGTGLVGLAARRRAMRKKA